MDGHLKEKRTGCGFVEKACIKTTAFYGSVDTTTAEQIFTEKLPSLWRSLKVVFDSNNVILKEKQNRKILLDQEKQWSLGEQRTLDNTTYQQKF